MPYYTPEVIAKVKELDLYTYLKNYEPNELVHDIGNTYTTKTHDSLKISNGLWNWFSRGIGGKNALEYLIKVKDYSFIEAVERILNCERIRPPVQYKNEKSEIKLVLPKRAENNYNIIKYLVGRGIDRDIINECIDKDLIYEDSPYHNVVFVGYDDEKVPKYAGIRASSSRRFMQDAYGSNKQYSFELKAENESNSLHLFESAIDLLSYATMKKLSNEEWYNDNLLSLAGVYKPANNIEESKIPLALNRYLNDHQNISKIYLHLDNDTVGRTAALALKTVLKNKYEIIDEPPQIGKDFNDFLCAKLKINYKKNNERNR